MKKYYSAISIVSIILLVTCKEKVNYTKRPFFDSHKKYLGDSIFIDGVINKIIFKDTSYIIDSIVFSRYDFSDKLKSLETFNNGKHIFENVYYFESGRIKKYIFISEYNENYFYERVYNNSGNFVRSNGDLFFQGYIIDTVSKTLDIKKGSTICYRIYYPNPPDCVANIYIKYDDSTKYDVFEKSNFLSFLKTVYQDNSEVGTFKTDILLELKEKKNGNITPYSHEVIFKVVQPTGADMQR